MEYFIFLVIWYTELPARNSLGVRLFYDSQKACEFMDTFNEAFSPVGYVNRPILFGQTGIFGEVPAWDTLICKETFPVKKAWLIEKQ